MRISEAASQSGLDAKTIRYYEEIDLIRPALRAENGYRDYGTRDVRLLSFVKRSRALGFSVEACRELLSLYDDTDRASGDVKRIALARISDIDQKIAELHSMREALSEVTQKCHGDDRPDCPILEGLALPLTDD